MAAVLQERSLHLYFVLIPFPSVLQLKGSETYRTVRTLQQLLNEEEARHRRRQTPPSIAVGSCTHMYFTPKRRFIPLFGTYVSWVSTVCIAPLSLSVSVSLSLSLSLSIHPSIRLVDGEW